MSIEEMVARWERRCAEWGRLGVQVNGKEVAKEVLSDLHECASGSGEAILSLSDAASLSGYSPDHLSKLLRAGTIPNAGKKGAPRIRRKDLPMRPTAIASGGNLAYDVGADARRLQVRR